MISFKGYDEVIERIYKYGQEHVFKYWNNLAEEKRANLLNDLSGIDFEMLKALYEKTGKEMGLPDFSPAPFIPVPQSEDEIVNYNSARQIGIDHIKNGRVAAFVVAGGQGTRLGFEGPKGKYPVGAVSKKSLFQIHAEKILKYSIKYDTDIPWLVMTSVINHNETVEFFEENSFFGLNRDNVIIFKQNMIPSLDNNGKLILEEEDRIFKNPDGHGGSITALYTSGSLDLLKGMGIETISYFQVDNPLVKIVDPVFIGFHLKGDADVSSKAVKKACPEEKVGVFVRFSSGRIGVVEYSDLPGEKQNIRSGNGELQYSMGSIAIHLFNRDFLESITSAGDISLPMHVARKKIKACVDGAYEGINGFKFEKFVFDALTLTEKNVVFETIRDEEFAPVKNREGVDSLETAQGLMSNLYREWLDIRKISIPDRVTVIEISPMRAVEPDDLIDPISIPDCGEVYLE